jgi:hypothetical protein
MATIEEKLEELFAKVRSLPKDRQEVAAIALADIVEEEVYVLSEEELAVLEPALERAKRGEFASDAEVDEVLNRPLS